MKRVSQSDSSIFFVTGRTQLSLRVLDPLGVRCDLEAVFEIIRFRPFRAEPTAIDETGQ